MHTVSLRLESTVVMLVEEDNHTGNPPAKPYDRLNEVTDSHEHPSLLIAASKGSLD